MTERLYYDDSYLSEFEATVLECVNKDGKYHTSLDRSAFYPTSGGQPFDTGRLGDYNVTDVYVDGNGVVWHVTDHSFSPGDHLHGSIDMDRRTDHMCQHAADHMIAGTLYELTGATTIGLHIGKDVSTIDVSFKDGTTRPSDDLIRKVECIVNKRIRENQEIRCWFTNSEELVTLPIRKAPTVNEHIRIVAIGDFEMVACGGTHPRRTGEIGLVKIIDATPSRGKVRIAFLAGERAYNNYVACSDILRETARYLTTGIENVFTSVRDLKSGLEISQKQIAEYRLSAALQELNAIPCAMNSEGLNYKTAVLNTDRETLKRAALDIMSKESCLLILGTGSSDNLDIILACNDPAVPDLGALLRKCGGKGGGRHDFAQGKGTQAMLDNIVAVIKS